MSRGVDRLHAEIERLQAELDAARAAAVNNAGIARLLLNDAERARAERTEPATGEDVEQARAEVAHILATWWVSDGKEDAEQLADRILAALDLPGREQAWREENERLHGEITAMLAYESAIRAERDAANATLEKAREICPFDCDNCHDDECLCPRLGCAGS